MKIRPIWVFSMFGCFLLFYLLMILASNASHEKPLMSPDIDISDKQSLQQGAKLFMNYCSGCHSLRYLRYNSMAHDLGLTTFDGELDKDLLISNLIFTSAPIHSPIEVAMPATDARQWFGVPPPDLSLIARQRGADWLYTYLHSFYEDKKRPFGTNNILIPNVAMPNVLAPLSGRVIFPKNANGIPEPITVQRLFYVGDGQMTKPEFDEAVRTIVTFLVYVGEPHKISHYHLGIFVIIYFSIFLLVVWLLKKNYWKAISH